MYEHYHASYAPRNRLKPAKTAQVPLPGEYTHYAFSTNRLENLSKSSKDMHAPAPTHNLGLSGSNTTQAYETHFPPHERYVPKYDLQKTHPVTFSMSSSTTNRMSKGAESLRNTLSTDRGVGGSG